MEPAHKTPRERVALGILGAFLFSLVGTALYVFFCYEGYYPWAALAAAQAIPAEPQSIETESNDNQSNLL